MAKAYTVKSATLDDVVNYDDGDMNKWVLSLEDEQGNVVNDVAHWRPANQRKQSFAEGDQIEADIQNQPRGGVKLANPKLLTGQSGNGTVPSSGQQHLGGGTEVLDYSRDATGRSIEKQVVVKAVAQVFASKTELADADPEKFVAYCDAVDKFFLPPAPEGTEAAKPEDDIPF